MGAGKGSAIIPVTAKEVVKGIKKGTVTITDTSADRSRKKSAKEHIYYSIYGINRISIRIYSLFYPLLVNAHGIIIHIKEAKYWRM